MQTACSCNAQTISYQPPATTSNNLQTNKSTAHFSADRSLTGNEKSDQLVAGLLLVLVQLLIQQLGNNQQQSSGQNNNAAPELDFSDADKQHLLTALDANTANTQVGTISDTDASNHLTQGDGVELLTQGTSENHEVTDTEVRNFIGLRNPPGTPTLPLTDQQSQQVASQFSLTDVSIADNNGDGQISAGDHISGTQTNGGKKLDVDRLVTAELATSLNS